MKRTAIRCAIAAVIVLGITLSHCFFVSENCVLCSVDRCANLCLINLHTGDIGELEIYDVGVLVDNGKTMDTSEFSTNQTTGTFSFMHCAGLTGYRTTGTYNTCELEIPEKAQKIHSEHYCPDCYGQLVAVSNKGYLILDTYDPDSKQIYSMNEGDHHLIRVFDASVTMNEGDMRLKVVGTRMIEKGEDGYGRILIE